MRSDSSQSAIFDLSLQPGENMQSLLYDPSSLSDEPDVASISTGDASSIQAELQELAEPDEHVLATSPSPSTSAVITFQHAARPAALTLHQREMLTEQLEAHIQLLMLTYVSLICEGPRPARPDLAAQCWRLLCDAEAVAAAAGAARAIPGRLCGRTLPAYFGVRQVHVQPMPSVFSRAVQLRRAVLLMQAQVRTRTRQSHTLNENDAFDIIDLIYPWLNGLYTVPPWSLTGRLPALQSGAPRKGAERLQKVNEQLRLESRLGSSSRKRA